MPAPGDAEMNDIPCYVPGVSGVGAQNWGRQARILIQGMHFIDTASVGKFRCPRLHGNPSLASPWQ